jgi:hypothetical protein
MGIIKASLCTGNYEVDRGLGLEKCSGKRKSFPTVQYLIFYYSA